MLPIRPGSSWNQSTIESFLDSQLIPVRLAAIDNEEGFPLISSLWYFFADNKLWCASHESSRLSHLLIENPNCAFEISPNEMPYRGVRGQGKATLTKEHSGVILNQLISRYLKNKDNRLSQWLLSRVDCEYTIKIEPRWITAWDYTNRMETSLQITPEYKQAGAYHQ